MVGNPPNTEAGAALIFVPLPSATAMLSSHIKGRRPWFRHVEQTPIEAPKLYYDCSCARHNG